MMDTPHPVPPHRPRARTVARDPASRVRRLNRRSRWYDDLYHRTLMLPWPAFLLLGCGTYLVINLAFAVLYLLQPGSILGAAPSSFWDAFFFSVQTIATIGYGQMSPATFYANILVTFETMTGLVFLALATGITFARISRPTARVMFSACAVVGPYNGAPVLTFRLGNERASQILEADVAVVLLRYERLAEGTVMRRFYDLPLMRAHTPIFALTFSVMHRIDENSPLHGATAESLAAEQAEFLITVTGLEEVTSQTVHARSSYFPSQIRFGHRFVDIFVTDPDGHRMIDYARFDQTEPC